MGGWERVAGYKYGTLHAVPYQGNIVYRPLSPKFRCSSQTSKVGYTVMQAAGMGLVSTDSNPCSLSNL